jgi:hypothetical protein
VCEKKKDWSLYLKVILLEFSIATELTSFLWKAFATLLPLLSKGLTEDAPKYSVALPPSVTTIHKLAKNKAEPQTIIINSFIFYPFASLSLSFVGAAISRYLLNRSLLR